MSSALQLTAMSTILSGQGLAPNSALTSAISSYQALPTVSVTANIFAASTANIDVGDPYLGAILANIGTGVATSSLWLLDFYPANIAPVSSGAIGYVFQSNSGPSMANIGNLASVSKTVTSQANTPFTNGLTGFANVWQTSYGYATQVFETVSSIYMLQGKTYANAGIGYTGAASLATAGVGNAGTVIASTVSNWGTMYDASHINLIGDPYVFGQNLLNQGLGNYGNLSAQLTAAGLDVTDITKVPATVSTTTQVSSQLTVSTSVGQVLFPTHTNVTTTNTVTASSPDVVLAIYKSITGNDLASIVSATQFTAPVTSLKTLADFLDFTKVLPLAQQSTYIQLGITDLDSLGAYIHNVIGQGYFNGWQDIASTLGKITVPQFSANNTTSGNSALLSGATVSTLSNYISYGSGVFNNPIMSDYLGAAAGMPYTANYNALIKAYYTIAPTIVVTALNTLQTTVTSYLAASSGAKAGLVSSLTSQVSAVNSALNSLSNTATYYGANVAYYSVMNKLSSEVSNLASAHVTFGTGTANGLFAFAQNIGTQFNDNVQIQTTQVMANLITNDSYGDTIRAAIAETDNISVLSSKGILTNNDPNPSRALQLATQQNIPISTYLMLNK